MWFSGMWLLPHRWGLMQVPFHKPVHVALGKQYWAMMHYSRFIRRGFTILSTNNHGNVVAAVSPKSSAGKVWPYLLVLCSPEQSLLVFN